MSFWTITRGSAALFLVAAGAAVAETPDPNALAALDKMGTELRTHQIFDVKSDVSMVDVLGSGQ